MRRFLIVLGTVFMGCGGSSAGESPQTPSGVEPQAATEQAAQSAPSGEGETTSAADDPSQPEQGDDENTFQLRDSDTAKDAHGATESKIKPSETEAAMKFFVVDKDKGPIEGIVISLTAPDGKKYYTQETDAKGYAEVLVPVGQKYDLVYLSLGRKDIAASVPVTDEANQNIKLTLRYKRNVEEKAAKPRFVLKGIVFDTGKATIRPESYPRLDRVVEYMAHKKSARIEISGHTDDVGKPKANQDLSERRAKACREYIISKGIDGSRIDAVGFGDTRPIAPNDTPEGRQRNRRIEAREL
jgi:outer membrane protein OmpA-like peptidoglycan-associated protein